ncbi:hypothetical protein F511_47086 [Dorcoceras hygrometricum]|uniref:Uncharacterized protein n=1 Tax=Dorcoceras hygrometricum TaxID=472368 RepID=A0A2Z6ZZ77_9LAMI|nr:hypothetical protein F511_47086 [Dorcoceras hygrometricum]
MHEAQPLRMKLADDALSLRHSRMTTFDAGGAPVGRRSAHLCCDAARHVAHPGRDVARRGGAAARMAGRWSARDRRWKLLEWATLGAALVDARCALVAQRRARCRREFFVVAAPPSPAAAPAMLRRVSDDVVTAGLNSF